MINSDTPRSNVTKENRPLQESPPVMNLAVKCNYAESIIAVPSVDNQIRSFLNGENDGEAVLRAIYDHVLDEPVPERLKALFKR